MTFDLDLWPTDLNINRGHLLIKDYLPTKFEASGAKRSWVISCTRWSRLAWPLTLIFDLNINRGHLLIKDYLPTKFEASWAKHSWVISCTRLRDTDIPTDQHVQSNMPLLFQRGHNKQVKSGILTNNDGPNNKIYALIFDILCLSEWVYASQNRLTCYFQNHWLHDCHACSV